MVKQSNLTYISLFSGAGVGCYGFKLEEFECVATVELIDRRIRVQEFNKKCKFDSGYIKGNIEHESTKNLVRKELLRWGISKDQNELDVLIATPPCQGMSVANHKKKEEIKRNSLVLESIQLIKEIQPRFFIFENVRSFLTTVCTDVDGNNKTINEAIDENLAGKYNILYTVLNFKEYGNPSSRTRTLVLGTRKDLIDISPYDIHPIKTQEFTLREVIGFLPKLDQMGAVWESDVFHSFRTYSPHMRDWIKELKEGESAFENKKGNNIPHRIINGEVVFNKNKNSDKYKRQVWDKVAPCIHTRNDILSSQNTIHPCDDRVFSIRELMLLMSIPNSFKWVKEDFEVINNWTLAQKQEFLRKEELNIRQCIGEAVPTAIFQNIAQRIKNYLNSEYSFSDLNRIITVNDLTNFEKTYQFINKNLSNYHYSILSKIVELANNQRNENAAFYTRTDICFSVVESLPSAKSFKSLKILEPSVGAGNFLFPLIEKYRNVENVEIDILDIDKESLEIIKLLFAKINIPPNIKVRFIKADFLLHDFTEQYDIVIGNPPFKKLKASESKLALYRQSAHNKFTNNIYSFFVEKSLRIGNVVALIVPKSILSTPEMNMTRDLIEKYHVLKVIDYGEQAFHGVKIETVCIVIGRCKTASRETKIESYITKSVFRQSQHYIMDKKLPYWLIYRDAFFDEVLSKHIFDIFNVFRDRQITKQITSKTGRFRVIKSRNIGSLEIINIEGYDSFINDLDKIQVARFLNKENIVLVPNLTYAPRACFLPPDSITDGSVAILTAKNGFDISSLDLQYYGSKEFRHFYQIARNFGSRSLNIDSNSVYFFGIKNDRKNNSISE